jgi:hypothetical protein
MYILLYRESVEHEAPTLSLKRKKQASHPLTPDAKPPIPASNKKNIHLVAPRYSASSTSSSHPDPPRRHISIHLHSSRHTSVLGTRPRHAARSPRPRIVRYLHNRKMLQIEVPYASTEFRLRKVVLTRRGCAPRRHSGGHPVTFLRSR